MKKLYTIDLFAGILGFHLAATRNGHIETICTSEIDPYCNRLISEKFNLDNAGAIETVSISRNDHPHKIIVDADQVPVEETGLTSLCIEDFYDDIVPWPNIISGGFPCQNISSANLHGCNEGIKGEKSGLIEEQLDVITNLEPEFCVFENAEKLASKGLDYILSRLNSLGYIVEWETISATGFGYPHYRHRCYIVAYLPSTKTAKAKGRIFDYVRAIAQAEPVWNIPLLEGKPEYIKAYAVAKNPKSIKLRTKRINGLGNAVIPDIVEAIYNVITYFELGTPLEGVSPLSLKERETHTLDKVQWYDCNSGLFESVAPISKMPSRGIMTSGKIRTSETRCHRLNPTKTKYQGLFSTLIRKDGNNNFSCKSRATRPGKLGGLVGEIMSLGVSEGGLNPEFCEPFMGYHIKHTELPCYA